MGYWFDAIEAARELRALRARIAEMEQTIAASRVTDEGEEADRG